jgi:hypothetical protein
VNIISRIFCYPLLESQLARERAEIVSLKEELKDWQNKTLNKQGFSPLGDEKVEATSGHAAKAQAFDMRPPIAAAHARWEEEEEEALREGFEPLAPDLSEEDKRTLLEEAEAINLL